MRDTRRRRSRLFSGQPDLLLVSEDIPGIVMPAPPPKDLAPLEDEEPEFDIAALHLQEDIEEKESGHEGPLRVFVGSGTQDALEASAVEDAPVFDASALAMPDATDLDGGLPEDDDLQFLDDSVDVDDAEVVPLGEAPPPLTMGGSSIELGSPPLELGSPPLDGDGGQDSPEQWDDAPTRPAIPRTAFIRDTAPAIPVMTDADPFDAPERESFVVGDARVDDFSEDSATRVEAIEAQVDPVEAWDDEVSAFFEGETEASPRGIPSTPPQLKVEPPSSSRSFKPIPDRADPPVIPVLVLLVGIVIMSLILWVKYVAETDSPASIPTQSAVPARVPIHTPPPPARVMFGEAGVVATEMGFLSVDSDKPANVYVGDQKMGITPIVKVEVQPGNHRVLAVEVETGKRKALTAQVARGEERRVRFEFQPERL